MQLRPCYPNGKEKAFTVSYDDGKTTDRRLVEILNTYGVKGSFHLNYNRMKRNTGTYVSLEEAVSLYQGHEMACHGADHRFLNNMSRSQQATELMEDKRGLEALAGQPVTGFSYPFGAVPPGAAATLAAFGFEYARSTASVGDFRIPNDFYHWNPTCHHDEDAQAAANRFLEYRPYMELELFYVWGHSYEFEQKKNWGVIERLCKAVAGQSNVWKATSLEIKRYLQALRSVVSSADGNCLYNPTAETLYYTLNDRLVEIAPGSTRCL